MSTDRFDRQNRVYGIEGTQKIQSASVSIVGTVSDLTYEIAKNLALSGINHINLDLYNVSINESNNILTNNILTNFTLGSLHECLLDTIIIELKKLNPYVNISLNPISEITNSVVICVGMNRQFDKIIISDIEEKANKVICFWPEQVDNNVVLRFVADFKNHIVIDTDGENYELITIETICPDIKNQSVFNIKTTANHNLDWGSVVNFKLRKSCGSIFDFTKKIKSIINSHTFAINIYDYDIDDINVNHLLKDALNDFTNGYICRQKDHLHLTHEPIELIIKSNNLSESFNNQIQIEILSPLMQYYVGSLLASEAIKAITCKYLPINQTMDLTYSNEVSHRPSESVAIKLANLKCFMVGSGAIGCELLKNLVAIGTATNSPTNSPTNSYIKLTDPDHIEVSNLSRQFLFRSENVSKSKSETARDRINAFSPNTNIIAYQEKLSTSNQSFVDEHFSQADIILNALDNLSARLYVDTQCVKHTKPLFESGTLGTKGNTQPVIPHITESYGASQDQEQESSFPACTIKNFPTLIQHTIHWAMDDFDGLFVKQPQTLKQYLKAVEQNDYTYLESIPQNEQNVIKNIVKRLLNKCYLFVSEPSVSKYIIWACQIYQERFANRINRLLKTHPEDSMTDSKLFWSNGKKCPKPITSIDLSDETTRNFIIATTKLLANTYIFNEYSNALISLSDDNLIKLIEETLNLYESMSDSGKIYCDDPDLYEDLQTYAHTDNELNEKLQSVLGMFKINPQDFEKDEDTNNHILFVQSDSNSRAQNYDIPFANFYETKGIAGKIIPALATTTSIVASLIVMELVKYLNNPLRPISDYASTFVNIASNFIVGSEPIGPTVNEVNGMKLTQWGLVPTTNEFGESNIIKFESDKNMVLSDFIKHWSDKFNSLITMVCLGSKIIYMEGSKEGNLGKTLNEITNGENCLELCLAAEDETLELPDIKIV